MSIQIRLTSLLQRRAGGARLVEANGHTLKQVLDDVERRYPGFQEELLDQDGKLKPFVNIFINDEDIRFLQGLDTALREADVVSILPAVAGGRAI